MNKMIIKKTISVLIASIFIFFTSCKKETKKDKISMETVVNEALEFSVQQSLKMAESLKDKPNFLPKTTDRFGNLETCESKWWVSGFFPGTLWYLYEYSNNEEVKKWAHEYTLRVKDEQYTTDNHDVGFMIYCSFGNAYRLTKDDTYKEAILNASKSLSTRFNTTTKAIKSWDSGGPNNIWQYPVIIDNMMNLELLMWSSEKFDDPNFKNIAITHANTTLKNHFRKDNSSYHVISYDTISGQAEFKHTAQGFNNESAWARGQAWGLYGYTLMYRFTKDPTYLKQAENIASFMVNHPNLPEDKIPFWDFNAPNIPDTYRDASAAAIMCSALLELSEYTNSNNSAAYLKTVETQIRTLSSPQYRNALGNNANFILKHGVGHLPANSEVDVPLTYADYYFVEALMRYKKLKEF
ncbi:Glycosyl Hydrolase Family 88 [Lutibacter flavus]|uniref:Glycosyl Hydrolase Family 88 n=2 Tax=Lutibacter flavus TaxID=691689 RepID=A0A238VC96_9FLAO|nr:Glycosyl Hydrolase Family 88 [Lutibacter flavus]